MSWTRERLEFLLERAVLKVLRGDGTIDAAIKFSEPRGMWRGKAGWEIFTCFTEFFPPLRGFTSGPCVTFGVFDGLYVVMLERLMRARHAARYELRRFSDNSAKG